MKRFTFAFPAALALTLMLLAPLAAQPRPLPSPSLSMYALLYLGDPALQKELKLSETQVKKLDEQRNDIGRLAFMLGADQAQIDEATKKVDKAFADILEPAQVKRLRQVMLQQLARGTSRSGSGSIILANTPAVAKELNLTDDQKAKLGPEFKLIDVLTDAQKKTWTAMIGEPFETVLRFTLPGGPRGPGGVDSRVATLPRMVQYLLQKSVAEELKLSEGQAKKVAALQVKWQQESPTRPRTDEERQKVATLTTAFEKDVAELLGAAQNKRLKQILVQQALPSGREADVFTLPEVVTDLKLSDGQNAKIESIQAERRKALIPLFLTGEQAEAIEKKVEAHKKETYGQLLAVLNDRQQTQLKELIGEPFKGVIDRRGSGGPGGFRPGAGGPGAAPFSVTTAVYLSTRGLRYVENKPLQDELKLTEMQVKRLVELQGKSLARTTAIFNEAGSVQALEKLYAQQAKDDDKALAEILEAKQVTRFKQIILQYYVARYAERGSSLTRFVEVVEDLQLTKEQKEQVQQGKELVKVLDEKQQAKWKEMLGAPFEKVGELTTQPGRGGRPAFQPGRPAQPAGGIPPGQFVPQRLANVLLGYLEQKSVQEDLKLTEGQVKKLPEVIQKWEDLTKERATWERGAAYTKKLSDAHESLDKAIAGLLEAKQVVRLHQIDLQQTQKRGLERLLFAEQVRKGLQVSEDQINKITDINEDALKTEDLIYRELDRGGRRDEEDLSKTLDELSKITEKKLNAVLTPKQHEQLKPLLGEPFKGELRRNRGSGGPGVGGAFPG